MVTQAGNLMPATNATANPIEELDTTTETADFAFDLDPKIDMMQWFLDEVQFFAIVNAGIGLGEFICESLFWDNNFI